MMCGIKRLLAMFLAVTLCLSSLPLAVLAEVTEIPDGTELPVQETESAAETTEPEAAETFAAEAAPLETEVAPTEPSVQEVTEPVSATLTTLTVKTLPNDTEYLVGQEIDLTGLVLLATDETGAQKELTPADGIVLHSGDTSAAGIVTVTVGYEDLTVSFSVTVHAVEVEEVLLASNKTVDLSKTGSYQSYFTTNKTLTWSGAQSLRITFGTVRSNGSQSTIYLYDGAGNQIGVYSDTALSNQTVTIPGDTVKIKYQSYMGSMSYSIVMSYVYACKEVMVHPSAGDDRHVEPTCFADGYDSYTCAICEKEITTVNANTKGHTYSDGFCIRCDRPENPNYSGDLTDTLVYAFTTADKTLYLCGVGTIPDDVYEKITLPYSYERVVIGTGITGIGSYAFRNRTGIKSVVLPEGLMAIDSGAFYGCSGLSEISIPGSVASIGGWAFSGCTGLTDVSIPGSVAVIGGYAFEKCSNLTAVTLASGLRELGSSAFNGCTKLSSIALPDTLKKIGGSAFQDCKALTAITIPDGVTELGDWAFRGCTGLKHIYIPAGVVTIPAKDKDNSWESGVFLACSNITVYCGAAEKPEGWGQYWNCWLDYTATGNTDKFLTPIWGCSRRSYEYWANLDLTGVEHLVIPDGIDAIPNSAFSTSTTLKSVTMPDSVKHIGDRAFYSCKNITEITLSEGLLTIGDEAFYGTGLKELGIPEGVTSIGYGFLDSTGVTEITLPASLEKCGSNGLNGLFGTMGSNVKTVTFADGTKKIPDYALSHTWSMLGNSITEVNLPDSLQSVGDYAFYGCSGVKVFDLPDNITTIGNYAFAGCSGAKTIDLPEELLHIGSYAFQGCTGVDFAIIPDKVRDIGDYAFQDCTALDSVKLNEGLLILGSGVFYNCPKLLKLRLPSTLTTAGHYYKQGPMYGSYVETVTVPKELREIPAYLFASDCFTIEDSEPYSRIETIEFEDIYELTGVGEYAFYGCVSLSGFSGGSGLPGAVGEIAPYTFYGCKKLTDFILEDGITVIGEYAFHGCEKLLTIYIPDTVQTIGAHAFSDCKALHTITIPAGATVGNCAYESCAGATSLTIGDGATIGMSAFFNCRKLKSITIGKNVTFMDRPFGSMQYYGDCTDTLSWNLNMETGLLTVSGTGAIPDYSVVERAPWHPYGYFISELQIGGDVTAVGNYAFADLQRLESVVLHENIRRVGESAFSGCAALRYAQLPAGLQTLDKNAFDPCAGLETVQFMGNAPSLGDTCFGSKTVEVRYPSNAVGFTGRVRSRFPNVIWTVWEVSQAAREIVILMDTSSDMAPYADTMVEAVGTIVNALGGSHRNTRIALAGYRNQADILHEMTADTVALEGGLAAVKEQIAQNSAYAGVKTGLDLAYSQLKDSSAEGRYVIVLTAQSPDDNRQAWLTAAQTLRSKATLFAVGISAADTLRKDLTDMAGSADRYYDLESLDDLIAYMNRPEIAGAAMTYMGRIYDLLTETAELSLLTNYTAEFSIRPGKQSVFADTATIALRQDSRILMQNETGDFTVHPGSVFVKDKAVEAVFFDASGGELGAVELKLTFRDSYTVTYVFAPDVLDPETGKPRVYLTASHAPGTILAPPENPERQGYTFKGWYTSTSYGGYEFFDPQNAATLRAVNADMTLYGKWLEKTDSLIMGVDTWRFLNAQKNFSSGKYGYGKIKVYSSTLLAIKKEININVIEAITTMGSNDGAWGGSCAGMSAAAVLAKAGVIDIERFVDACRRDCDYTGEYGCVHDAVLTVYPAESGYLCPIEDMINFYQYRDSMSGYAGRSLLDKFSFDESANLENIIEDMKATNFPVALSVGLRGLGGHAVVAFDLERTDDGYSFQVYDCSLSDIISYPVTVTINEDGDYVKVCPEWEAAWRKGNESKFKGILIRSCSTVNDLTENLMMYESGQVSRVSWVNDRENWEKIYSAFHTEWAGYDTGSRSMAEADSDERAFHILYTSGGSFTITDGTRSAVIRDGEKVSGDLPILCAGQTNNVGEASEYSFALPALAGDGEYTVKQSGSGEMTTTFRRFHADENKDFLVSHQASVPGELSMSSDGKISTHYETETAHTLRTVRNDASTPWSMVELSGTGTGFRLAQDADKVVITSDTDTAVRVTTTDFITESTLDAVPVSDEQIQVQEGGNASCVITRDGEVIASAEYGCSVVFLSQGGSDVESILNVAPGSLVAEPEAPVRTGFVFTGWYTDAECTDLWDFASDRVDADVCLYAGWDADPDYVKSVTFRVPGKEDQIIYLPAGSLIDPGTAPLSDNGEALQWYETERFVDTPWDFSVDTVMENIVLYGRTPLYTVTFVTGTDTALPDCSVNGGSSLAEPDALQNYGHTFCGWYADPDFALIWNFDTDVVTGDLTLYARWLPNEFDSLGTDTGICIEIVAEESIVYTGKALKPSVIVRDNGVILKEKTDYIVSYKNNTNACRGDDETVRESKRPQITITGKSNYKTKQKIVKYFTILPVPMEQVQVTIADSVPVKSADKLQKLTPKVSTGAATLSSKAYTVRYFTDEALTREVSGLTAAGNYYVALEAVKVNGEYTGNATGMTEGFPVYVVPADRLVSKAKITLPKTITACTQAPDEAEALPVLLSAVTMGKARYEIASDNFRDLFTVTAVDTDGTRYDQSEIGRVLTSVGKKTLHVTAKPGNAEGYAGGKSVSITVKGIKLSKKQFLVTFADADQKAVTKTAYSGIAQTPNIITELVEGVDYRVAYRSGKQTVSPWQIRDAGSYTLEIQGIGRYTGKLTGSFSISKVDIAKAYADGKLTITTPGTATHSSLGAKLRITVALHTEWGGVVTMLEGRDYTLKFSDNKNVTTKAHATLTGKGNFTGSLSRKTAPRLQYTVQPKPLSDRDITITVTGISYKNNVVSGVKFAVYDAGKKLAANQYTGSFAASEDAILLTVTGTLKNYTGTRRTTIDLPLISAADLKQVSFRLEAANKWYYTGTPIRPAVRIADEEGTDISDCFYVTYGANTNVGNGTVTITGKPEKGYYGTKTLRFTILPKWSKWLFGE